MAFHAKHFSACSNSERFPDPPSWAFRTLSGFIAENFKFGSAPATGRHIAKQERRGRSSPSRQRDLNNFAFLPRRNSNLVKGFARAQGQEAQSYFTFMNTSAQV